jgi:hypothetical protein
MMAWASGKEWRGCDYGMLVVVELRKAGLIG